MRQFLTTLALSQSLLSIGSASAASVDRPHCNLGLLTKVERNRDAELAPLLAKKAREIQELPDGFAFRFEPDAISNVAEFAAIASKCCQPLNYQVELGPQPGGSLWVRISGSEGAKEFIRGEFELFFKAAEKLAASK